MTQFPVEVLANIIEYCDAASSLQLRLLCRASNQMCNARNLHIVAFREACQRNFSKAKGSKTKASHWLCCWPAEYQAVAASEFNASDLVHLPCCYHNSPVIPPSLSIATKLTKICIRDASLTAIPRELYDLVKLRALDLSNNNISGPISKRFIKLTNLRYLSLSHNQVDGNFDGNCFPSISLLEQVKLDHNNLTGALPNSFDRLKHCLNLLDLSHNRFTGPIPDVFRSFPKLEHLILSHNDLSGSISPEIHGWQSIRNLYLDHNRITGEIPDAIGVSMRRLEKLFLNNNRLSGSIPHTLGNAFILKVLSVIYFESNLLEGAVPAVLSTLPELSKLDLSHNLLSGRLPNELGQANRLKFVAVNGNRRFDFSPLVAPTNKNIEIQKKCPPNCPDCR